MRRTMVLIVLCLAIIGGVFSTGCTNRIKQTVGKKVVDVGVDYVKNWLDNGGKEYIERIAEERAEKIVAQKFESLGIDPKTYELVTPDGRVNAREAFRLAADTKKRSEEKGQPMQWYEILGYVAGAIALAYAGFQRRRAKKDQLKPAG